MIMRTKVIIENICCEDCKSLVQTEIIKLNGISNISISIKEHSLSFDYMSHNSMEGLRLCLKNLGYPITQDPNLLHEDLECIESKS